MFLRMKKNKKVTSVKHIGRYALKRGGVPKQSNPSQHSFIKK